MKEILLGIAVTAIPLLAVGYLLLRRKPAIFRMFVAMVLIGVGYLTATGAMFGIGSHFTDNAQEPVIDTAGPAETDETGADTPEADAGPEPEAETPAEPETEPQPSTAPDEPATEPEAPESTPSTEPAPATP